MNKTKVVKSNNKKLVLSEIYLDLNDVPSRYQYIG